MSIPIFNIPPRTYTTRNSYIFIWYKGLVTSTNTVEDSKPTTAISLPSCENPMISDSSSSNVRFEIRFIFKDSLDNRKEKSRNCIVIFNINECNNNNI